MTQEVSVVVCGWHFQDLHIYKNLTAEAKYCKDINLQFYIASHKYEDSIGQSVLESLRGLGFKILFFENEGWDWGAYQQFLQWQKKNDHFSDFYLFLHDDIYIKKQEFIPQFLQQMNNGVHVVGNSASSVGTSDNKRLFPEDILWASLNGFDIHSEKWDVVRGSCFFTDRLVAEEILANMPVKKGRQIFQANRSLRIFGGLVTDRFGEKSITHLSKTPRSSEFIDEHLRGEQGFLNWKSIKSSLYPYINKDRIFRWLHWTKAPVIPKGSGLRLNLGSGNHALKYYFNVDKFNKTADMNADIFELEFKANSIAEILLIHVFEHIEFEKVPVLLGLFHGWLKPQGQLILEFPDLIKCCRLILHRRFSPTKLQTSPFGVQGLFGGNPKYSIYDHHKWGWTKTNVIPLLKKAGFSKIIVERPRFHRYKRDTRIVAIK